MAVAKWETPRAAMYGAAAGAVYGVMQIASGSGPTEPVLIYYLVFLVGLAGGGAVMFAIVAALRNILVR